MSKRLNHCRTCWDWVTPPGKFNLRRGLTRHDDRICSQCRKCGPPQEPVNYPGRAA